MVAFKTIKNSDLHGLTETDRHSRKKLLFTKEFEQVGQVVCEAESLKLILNNAQFAFGIHCYMISLRPNNLVGCIKGLDIYMDNENIQSYNTKDFLKSSERDINVIALGHKPDSN